MCIYALTDVCVFVCVRVCMCLCFCVWSRLTVGIIILCLFFTMLACEQSLTFRRVFYSLLIFKRDILKDFIRMDTHLICMNTFDL